MLNSFTQNFSPEEQKQLEYLNSVINNPNSHDTSLADAYIGLSELLYIVYPDTDMYICETAVKITEKALAKRPNAQVRKRLLRSQAEAMNNIGYIYSSHGDNAKAIEYYNRGLLIHENHADKRKIANALNNIALAKFNLGKVKAALGCWYRAEKLQVEVSDKKGRANVLNSIGYVFMNQGDIPKCIEYFDRSLRIKEEIGDTQGIALSTNNIGFIYMKQGDQAKALEYFQRALESYEEIGDKWGQAFCLNNIGGVYDGQKELLKSMEYYKRALKLREDIDDKKGIANSFSNIGGAYKDMGDLIKALEYHSKSLKIREEIADMDGIATTLINIGTMLFDNQKTTEAKKIGLRSLTIANELGYPETVRNAAALLSSVYKKERNWNKALKMYELHIEMRDSINNSKTEKAAIKQQTKYEYEKRAATDSIQSAEQKNVLNAQIIAQNANLSQERSFKYSLFGGLGLVILFSLFIINRLRLTRRQKVEIELKNTALNDRNIEIAYQKELVEQKNTEILDSITYAQRIQSAILPPFKLIEKYLPNSFVLYKPKDIVAGDFYWLEPVVEVERAHAGAPSGSPKGGANTTQEEIVYFAAADCTGHGVPGAMMSVMCSNALTKCVKELQLTKPSEILDETTKIIESRFERSEQLVLDGMDLALCKLNIVTKELEYAGANNPLWIVHGESASVSTSTSGWSERLLEIKADKQPIGQYDDRKPYTNHKIQLKEGDSIYIFSDGYIDQFGGPKGKKLKAKAFKKLILSIQDNDLSSQLVLIDNKFEEWKGEIEQIDDVCVIGVRV